MFTDELGYQVKQMQSERANLVSMIQKVQDDNSKCDFACKSVSVNFCVLLSVCVFVHVVILSFHFSLNDIIRCRCAKLYLLRGHRISTAMAIGAIALAAGLASILFQIIRYCTDTKQAPFTPLQGVQLQQSK
jgi:hypothetical protein